MSKEGDRDIVLQCLHIPSTAHEISCASGFSSGKVADILFRLQRQERVTSSMQPLVTVGGNSTGKYILVWRRL